MGFENVAITFLGNKSLDSFFETGGDSAAFHQKPALLSRMHSPIAGMANR
jgi:hypothetical protein